MHVLLISACEKRAIKKTNAIIDSYAVRVGDRTWVTPITAEALAELHAALRRVFIRRVGGLEGRKHDHSYCTLRGPIFSKMGFAMWL